MKINITKKEYRTLLDVFEIADWVLHSYKTADDPETERYRVLEQKFLSLAKDMGFKHLVEYDAKTGQYFPTKRYEEESSVMKFIDEYDNETFWDELSERLAFRDLIMQEGEEKVRAMSLEERFQKVEALREKYLNEFQMNGLNRIKIESITTG